MNEFATNNIFGPLGMVDTAFNPPESLRQRAAATDRRDGEWLVGSVHDPRAHRLGGVAGHAGLFSTSADLIRFGESFLKRDSGADPANNNPSILSGDTIDMMTTASSVPGGLRGLGWDIQTGYSSNRAAGYSESAYGHGGFTGTVIWIDPQQQIVFVLLSNRHHPDGDGNVNRLAADVADELLGGLQGNP